jgi:hypothetical protein
MITARGEIPEPVSELYPQLELEYFLRLTQILGYHQHGGSGLCWGRSEVLSCPLMEAEWHARDLAETREKEAQEIRRASRQKKWNRYRG